MTNDMRFDDQVAVITGAGGGLGKQYSLLLASRGARVVVNDTGGSVTGDGANTDTATVVAEEIILAPVAFTRSSQACSGNPK